MSETVQPEEATIIISVYKNVDALRLVLKSLELQDVSGFELVVSEDGQDPAMHELLSSYRSKRFVLTHLSQEDVGWRKNQALNKAVRHAKGKYLIFIDGDCFLHQRFVSSHLDMSQKRVVLSGNRVLLGAGITQRLLERKLDIERFISRFWRYAVKMLRDGGTRIEEGLYINPHGLFKRLAGKPTRDILGCNFSCFKSDLTDINGFDEDYIWPRAGEDNDVRWRMLANGCELKSVRNVAIQYHLFHGRPHYTKDNPSKEMMLRKIQQGIIYCEHGLNTEHRKN